jgi:hypothetical protein
MANWFPPAEMRTFVERRTAAVAEQLEAMKKGEMK